MSEPVEDLYREAGIECHCINCVSPVSLEVRVTQSIAALLYEALTSTPDEPSWTDAYSWSPE